MKISLRALGFALAACAAFPAAAADDEDVIAYRQHLMQALNAQTAALGMIFSGAAPEDNTVAHMDAIALTASIALTSFEPKVQGGEAKPEVWTEWADFSARMNDFAQNTAEMARVAREQGKDEAMVYAIDALSCKSCHDIYNKSQPTE